MRRSLAGPSRPHSRFDADAARDAFRGICEERGLDMEHHAVVASWRRVFRACAWRVGHRRRHKLHDCDRPRDDACLRFGLRKRLERRVLKRNLGSNELWPWKPCYPAAARTRRPCRAPCRTWLRDMRLRLHELHRKSRSHFGPRCAEVAGDIELASVLSGNRNFDGRISPDVSPELPVCSPRPLSHAIAGTMDFDFETQELGLKRSGQSGVSARYLAVRRRNRACARRLRDQGA